jgi:hypothetical protein
VVVVAAARVSVEPEGEVEACIAIISPRSEKGFIHTYFPVENFSMLATVRVPEEAAMSAERNVRAMEFSTIGVVAT